MSLLKPDKYELYAQARASGMTQADAYAEAGYKAKSTNACTRAAASRLDANVRLQHGRGKWDDRSHSLHPAFHRGCWTPVAMVGERGNPRGRDLSVASDDAGSPITARKILKVLRNPRLAAALVNAQLRIRGKARVPLSVRLIGRVRLRGEGDVEFGQGVSLVGDVVPIECPLMGQELTVSPAPP
jgi:hypothetical protein